MKRLCLTYDDGPNSAYTPELLDVLAKYSVKAVFFMVGMWVREQPELARRVAAEGHTIGNHTDTHPDLRKITFAQAQDELAACEKTLTEVIGPHSKLFRPPFLLWTDQIREYTESIGLTTVMKTSAAMDWNLNHDIEYMYTKVLGEQTNRSGIILLHDGFHEYMGADRSKTIKVTEQLIQHYQKKGFLFTGEPGEVEC